MPLYKLSYYNSLGLAEPIRYMFAIAGVDYEDHRIPSDEMHYPKLPPNIKDDLPWGTVPVLDVDGKHRIAQSGAIFRFLAKRFNLAGKDEFESASCDEIADAMRDFAVALFAPMSETDEAKKTEGLKKLHEVTIPFYMGKFNKIAEENGKWLVGNKLTWVDLVVAHFMTLIVKRTNIPFVDGYPAVQKLLDDVYAVPQVKEWIEKRPDTD